ncbi:MAG: DUF3465 domain-containing protein [Leptolyngbyaceae cyanobacterium]
MKRELIVGLLVLSITACGSLTVSGLSPSAASETNGTTSDQLLQTAFETQSSDLQVQGQGTVVRILTDDLEGSRHQRFILELQSGQTLLIAHNIDLAPRIDAIETGDLVEFYGEYEWNSEGGVIHWTHHDPAGEHVAGWLRHEGQLYQ